MTSKPSDTASTRVRLLFQTQFNTWLVRIVAFTIAIIGFLVREDVREMKEEVQGVRRDIMEHVEQMYQLRLETYRNSDAIIRNHPKESRRR